MNNDLEQFSEERLKYLSTTSSIKNGATAQESAALARIALAAKQAKPVAFIADCGTIIGDGDRFFDDYKNPQPLYTTPQPAHTEQAISDGWKLVPIEPTEDMVINGFESKPDKSFTPDIDWEAYDAMSGCEQAAHRAKLCWQAMLRAAPKPESE